MCPLRETTSKIPTRGLQAAANLPPSLLWNSLGVNVKPSAVSCHTEERVDLQNCVRRGLLQASTSSLSPAQWVLWRLGNSHSRPLGQNLVCLDCGSVDKEESYIADRAKVQPQ